MRPKRAVVLGIFLTLVAPDILRAQGSDGRQAPGQVAYIRLIEGEVGYQRGDDNQARWSAAVINTPMMPGDFLYANDRGRAEIQVGDGNFLRLGRQGYIGLLQSDDRTFQFKVASGVATLRLQNLDRSYEIDAPNVAFSAERPGEYRVDVSPAGETLITVHRGRGVASIVASREQELRARVRLDIANGSAKFTLSKKFKRDAWDRWNLRRDSLAYGARPLYLPPGVYGYESMSGHGTWLQSQLYGPVWVPAVAANWQPYRVGRWVWVDPFGWTWVSYEVWGWAPYHYGRWAYIEGIGWAWVPGPPTIRQRFAAALVAFLSGNEGGEWLGWFPLGPGEVYQPYVTREVYVVRPVRQYVNYNYVTIVNRTEIYNSSTAIYNTRIVDRQIIERKQVFTDCALPPSLDTLYVRAVHVTGNQDHGESNTLQTTPRPTEDILLRDVYVRTPEVPTVRKFDEKLAEIQKSGVVRPVSPFQPAHHGQVDEQQADESQRIASPHEPARPAYQPPQEVERRMNQPAGHGSGGQQQRPAFSSGQVNEQQRDEVPPVASPREPARPAYQPPQEVERRMNQPAGHGSGGQQQRPAISPGQVNEQQRDEVPRVASPREPARPAYQPPQEVEHRMNQPGGHGSGGQQQRPAISPGQVNEQQRDEVPRVPSPHGPARPVYQAPQDENQRMSRPALPRPQSQPQSAEQNANRSEVQSGGARKSNQLPSVPPAARAQGTPTPSHTDTPDHAPKAPVHTQTGSDLHRETDIDKQQPKAATRAEPPQQTKQAKSESEHKAKEKESNRRDQGKN